MSLTDNCWYQMPAWFNYFPFQNKKQKNCRQESDCSLHDIPRAQDMPGE